jgi:hypothetical protein
VAEERFRRSLRGYDPDEVERALSERDEHVERLEREAAKLAKRVREQEERMRETLDGGDGGFGSASPGAIGALSRRLEDIHAQARSQATRMRMKALQDVVQMSDRVSELAKLRDDLGARVQELAGMAGIKVGEQEGGAVGTAPSRAAAAPSVWSGVVQIEVGPLADFAQLTSVEDAAAAIEGASEITIRQFAGGRATISLRLGAPVDLVAELERRVPFGFRVRDARPESVVLDVEQGEQRRAA